MGKTLLSRLACGLNGGMSLSKPKTNWRFRSGLWWIGGVVISSGPILLAAGTVNFFGRGEGFWLWASVVVFLAGVTGLALGLHSLWRSDIRGDRFADSWEAALSAAIRVQVLVTIGLVLYVLGPSMFDVFAERSGGEYANSSRIGMGALFASLYFVVLVAFFALLISLAVFTTLTLLLSYTTSLCVGRFVLEDVPPSDVPALRPGEDGPVRH